MNQKYLEFRNKIIIENYRSTRVKLDFMRIPSREKFVFCRDDIWQTTIN